MEPDTYAWNLWLVYMSASIVAYVLVAWYVPQQHKMTRLQFTFCYLSWVFGMATSETWMAHVFAFMAPVLNTPADVTFLVGVMAVLCAIPAAVVVRMRANDAGLHPGWAVATVLPLVVFFVWLARARNMRLDERFQTDAGLHLHKSRRPF